MTVSDDELITAMTFFAERMKMLVEPTGCLAAAAAFDNTLDVKEMHVGVVLSGGNIDLKRFSQLIGARA